MRERNQAYEKTMNRSRMLYAIAGMVAVFALSAPSFADDSYYYRLKSSVMSGRGADVTFPGGDANETPDPLVATIAPTTPVMMTESVSTPIQIKGGIRPYQVSIAAGSLPSGVTFDAATQSFSGAPAQSGTYSVTVSVTDSKGVETTAPYSLTVVAKLAVSGTPTLSTRTEEPYSAQFTATGGMPNYTWVIEGTLPDGLTFANGIISGTPSPTAAGTYDGIIVSAVDTEGHVASRAPFTLTVIQRPKFEVSGSFPGATSSVSYSGSVSIVRGEEPFSASLASGSLPPGLSLSVSGRTITVTGTPTTPETSNYPFVLDIADGSGTVLQSSAAIKVVLRNVIEFTYSAYQQQWTVPEHNRIRIECWASGSGGSSQQKNGLYGYYFPSGNGFSGSAVEVVVGSRTLCSASGGAGSSNGSGFVGNVRKVNGNNGSVSAGGAPAVSPYGGGGNGSCLKSGHQYDSCASGGGSGGYGESLFTAGNDDQIPVNGILALSVPDGGAAYSSSGFYGGNKGGAGRVRITVE